jgi:hypothetical protein
MPSYNTRNNVIYMEHTSDVKILYLIQIYKSQIANSIDLAEDFSLENNFFYVNSTPKFFPTLSNKKENIPVGDSMSMCITVSWSPSDSTTIYNFRRKYLRAYDTC